MQHADLRNGKRGRQSKAKGLAVERRYYYGEGTHAKALYTKYQAATDAAWSSFLIRKLGL